MTDKMINNRVKKLRELEDQVSILKAQIDALKEELKEEVEAAESHEVVTRKYRIYINSYTQTRIDAAMLKKAGIYDAYVKPTTVNRFMISDVVTV